MFFLASTDICVQQIDFVCWTKFYNISQIECFQPWDFCNLIDVTILHHVGETFGQILNKLHV